MAPQPTVHHLANGAYHLTLTRESDGIAVRLHDVAMDLEIAAGPYLYRARRTGAEGSLTGRRLAAVAVEESGETITITGALAGLTLEHILRLPASQPFLEERITLRNESGEAIALEDLACGLGRRITDPLGYPLAEVAADRLAAIPFRHRPSDPPERDEDYAPADLLTQAGREHRANPGEELAWPQYGYLPSARRFAEGWAWAHGEHTLGVFKLNQEAMEFVVRLHLPAPGHRRHPRRPPGRAGAAAGHAALPAARSLLQAGRFPRPGRGGARPRPARRGGVRGEPLQPLR